MTELLEAIKSRRTKVTVVQPHTFGDPKSENFWSDYPKAELMDEAKQRNIKGRSKMTKPELVQALVDHERSH